MPDDFPYEITALPTQENDQIKKDFRAYPSGGVTVGPKKYFFQGTFSDYAAQYYNLPLSTTDVWVVTYPKCGTTWTQELVWMLVHDLDFEGGKIELDDRFPFIDIEVSVDFTIPPSPDFPGATYPEVPAKGFVINQIKALPAPRTIKSHLPFSFLPPALLSTCKTVYVVRDPRDVVVSYYYQHRMWYSHDFVKDFDSFCRYFMKEQVIWSPFWEHVWEAWEQRANPNLLLLTFEELKKDLGAAITKVAKFLGKTPSEEDMEKLKSHLHVDSMKANPSVNCQREADMGLLKMEEGGFIRKGKTGGWRPYFSEELKEEFEKWMVEKGRGLHKEFNWVIDSNKRS